jgi:hypothetical protein
LPSNHEVLTVVMKNWDPLVLGPALAMDKSPGCYNTVGSDVSTVLKVDMLIMFD